MKKILSYIPLTLICLIVHAQSEVAEHYNFSDSILKLNQEITATQDLKLKAQKLYEISYYYSDYAQSLDKLNEAQVLAVQLNDSLLSTEIGLEKAVIYNELGNYEQSVLLYDSLMPLYNTTVDERKVHMADFQYAKSLINAGRYYDALEIGLQSYNYFSKKENEETYSGLLSQVIASVYKKMGRTEEAMEQYRTSIKWCNMDDNPNCVSHSYQNLSNLYLQLDDISNATDMIDKSQKVIENHPELQWKTTYINLIKAKIKIAENQSKEALQLLNENFADVIKDQRPIQIANYHLQFAEAHLQNKAYNEALKNSTEALRIGNENQARSISQNAHYLNSQIFEKLGNSGKALEALRNYNAINESILSAEKIAQINELDAKYKAAKTENALQKSEKENALKALEIERGNQRKVFLITGVLLLVISLLMVLYFLKRKSKINALLAEKNTIISKSLQDKDILLREIHHRVKNNLQVVSSLLNLQANYISDDLALEAITEGKNRVSSMALIHQNLYRENNLTSINSKEYFDDLIDNLFDSYNIDEAKVQLTKEIDNLDIDVDTMIPLGLIVNELVSNSLKHAFKRIRHKGSISVELKEKNNVLILSVSDNGIGLTEDHFLSSDSFGNKMIKAFKQKLNAEIQIINDNGTTVSMHIRNYKLKAA